MLTGLFLAVALLACPAQDMDRSTFLATWNTAQKTQDVAALSKLLRKNRELAVQIFLDRAPQRLDRDIEEFDIWVDDFVGGWSETYHSDFPEIYDGFLQMLSPRARFNRLGLTTQNFVQTSILFTKALNSKTVRDWDLLHLSAKALLADLEAIGDLYFGSKTAMLVGYGYLEGFNPEGKDQVLALEFLAKAVSFRDKLGYTQDLEYAEMKKQVVQLQMFINGGAVATADAAPTATGIALAEGSEWVSAPLKHAIPKKPTKVAHACDLADDHRLSWRRNSGGGVGKEPVLLANDFLKPAVYLVRLGLTKFALKCGNNQSSEFTLKERPAMVSVIRDFGSGHSRPFTVWIATGNEKEAIFMSETNLAPNEASVPIFWRVVDSLEAKHSFGAVTLFDLDCNGEFGGDAPGFDPFGSWGCLPSIDALYRSDGVLLGAAKQSMPWSRWLPDSKGNWFELQLDDPLQAKEVKLRPVTPVLGRVKYSLKGVKKLKLQSLIIESTTAETKGLVLDLLTLKGKAPGIPVGSYRVVQGRMVEKKGGEVLIVPPKTGLRFTILADEETTLELGAPFQFAATVETTDNISTVLGNTLRVVGKAGEQYFRFVGAPLHGIELSAKGAKDSVMPAPSGLEVYNAWNRLYFPNNGVLEFSKPSSEPKIRLTLKKHPWFGKLDTILP